MLTLWNFQIASTFTYYVVLRSGYRELKDRPAGTWFPGRLTVSRCDLPISLRVRELPVGRQ
jgi:hypothetical protein